MTAKTYKNIAVIGVSLNTAKTGNKIFTALISGGYAVKGINPKGGEAAGRKLAKSLDELSEIPELVITITPPAVTEKIIENCAQLGIKTVWMQPGSESTAALAKAKRLGIKTITACFMVKEGLW